MIIFLWNYVCLFMPLVPVADTKVFEFSGYWWQGEVSWTRIETWVLLFLVRTLTRWLHVLSIKLFTLAQLWETFKKVGSSFKQRVWFDEKNLSLYDDISPWCTGLMIKRIKKIDIFSQKEKIRGVDNIDNNSIRFWVWALGLNIIKNLRFLNFCYEEKFLAAGVVFFCLHAYNVPSVVYIFLY